MMPGAFLMDFPSDDDDKVAAAVEGEILGECLSDNLFGCVSAAKQEGDTYVVGRGGSVTRRFHYNLRSESESRKGRNDAISCSSNKVFTYLAMNSL